MIEDLIDTIESLTLIMDEETVRLHGRERYRHSAAMVEAKLRLVAALEVRVAQLSRRSPDWCDELAPEVKGRLHAALVALSAASAPNQRSLARHIDLSTEMMGVVAAEAQRQSGARGATYGSEGTMTRIDTPSPISVNTSL
jgi:flagellar biosynthesis/type III secretory pathway chaperone